MTVKKIHAAKLRYIAIHVASPGGKVFISHEGALSYIYYTRDYGCLGSWGTWDYGWLTYRMPLLLNTSARKKSLLMRYLRFFLSFEFRHWEMIAAHLARLDIAKIHKVFSVWKRLIGNYVRLL